MGNIHIYIYGGFSKPSITAGGVKHSEKYEFVNWDDELLTWKKNPVMFQSPPTRYMVDFHLIGQDGTGLRSDFFQ